MKPDPVEQAESQVVPPDGTGDDRISDQPSRKPAAPAERTGRFRRRKRPVRKRLSQILDDIGADTSRSRISISDLMGAMSGRATGALLLIFALPNILPAPPGTSGILGLPLVYLAAQMMLGRVPWLPAFISNRSMSREDFVATISRATPILARAERLLKPRLSFLVRNRAERVIGAVCLLLALVLILPIPFGNMLPAFAIALIALGVVERDGLWVLLGFSAAVAAIVLVSGVVVALAKAAVYLLMNAF